MKLVCQALIALTLFSCKKTDNFSFSSPVTDSTFSISDVVPTNINEVDINYIINPPQGIAFSDIYLIWSTSSDFLQNKDSIKLSLTGPMFKTHRLKGLKQKMTYYGRLIANTEGQRIVSSTKVWTTEELTITDVGQYGKPWFLNKGEFTVLLTNQPVDFNILESDAQIFIGNKECNVLADFGQAIQFDVPPDLSTGKHIVELRKNGLMVYSTDSVEILRGLWQELTPPTFPSIPNAKVGLFSFGTCHSEYKGYMIGGLRYNWFEGHDHDMNSFYEFDAATFRWNQKSSVNGRYLENPICYYYNNSIYVVGGREIPDPNHGHMNIIKKMLRLDMNTLSWSELDSMPTYGNYHMASFELKNEWYIGFGGDSAREDYGYGIIPPNRKFWKYSPASNKWTRLSDFPGGDETFYQMYPTCFTIGDKAYAFLGAIPSVEHRLAVDVRQELWEYDALSDNWKQIPLPEKGGPKDGEKYQIVVYNGKAYFLTGQQRMVDLGGYFVAVQSSFLEWDPLKNFFTRISNTQGGGDVTKLIYSKNSQFVFQTDEISASGSFPNKTFLFDIGK